MKFYDYHDGHTIIKPPKGSVVHREIVEKIPTGVITDGVTEAEALEQTTQQETREVQG